MSNDAKTMAALQRVYQQILDIEASFNKLLAKEPEFKEAEKEQKELDKITSQLSK